VFIYRLTHVTLKKRSKRNKRNSRKKRKLQPIGTELSSFQLNSVGLKCVSKNQWSKILVRFLLVVQLMMQIKFNFNNFAHVSATAWQSASGIYAVVAGGCDWPIVCDWTSFRYVLCVPCVACVRWIETRVIRK